VYESSTTNANRNLLIEVVLAAIAAVLLGFGVSFLLLWSGAWL
jgi:hypothetical protein